MTGHDRLLLGPLLEALADYDKLRGKATAAGLTAGEARRLDDLLGRTIIIAGEARGSLARPQMLCEFIRELGDGSLNLQLRVNPDGMPAYYLCRLYVAKDLAHPLILEDIHLSPSYPIDDPGLLLLSLSGSERWCLRLSIFRDACVQLVEGSGEEAEDDPDILLCELGQGELGAMLHPDQFLVRALAVNFSLPKLQTAVELLYLCQNAGLCAIRNRADERRSRFFSEIYGQKEAARLLESLITADGRVLSLLPQKANERYRSLSADLRDFLDTEVVWGLDRSSIPLAKIVFANLFRLSLVSKDLRADAELEQARQRLNRSADRIIEDLLREVIP